VYKPDHTGDSGVTEEGPPVSRAVIELRHAQGQVDDLRARRRSWAQLIRRSYGVDRLMCPHCGAAMRIIAFTAEPRVIHTILRHLAATGVDARSPPGPRERHPTAA
jgi:hypothetical protein